MSTIEEKRAILDQSLTMLAKHEPFLQFMDAVKELKNKAIEDSVRLDVVDDFGKVASCLGEVRTYLDIENLVSEYAQKSLDSQ